MNANENSPKPNARLKRIQKVSGIFRTIFLASVILSGVGMLAPIPMFFIHVHNHLEPLIILATQIGSTVLSWFCYKLFNLYSRGELFSAKVVSYIRRIGYTYFLVAVVAFFSRMIFSQMVLFYFRKGDLHPTANSPNWAFDIFDLAGGLFLGFLIIFIAWIMDEGRKIQEEQELTV